MITGAVGMPASSTGTVEAHWPVIDTATTLVGSTAPDVRASFAAPRMTVHHSSASWVAPPSGVNVGLDLVVHLVHDAAEQRDEADLGSTGAEVDDQHVLVIPVITAHGAATSDRCDWVAYANGGSACCSSSMVAIDHLDELVGLVVHAAGDAAVDGTGCGGLVALLLGVLDRVGEVVDERLDHAVLGLRPGDRHVEGVGVLLAVEAPALRPHEVVDVVHVELVAREAEQERRARP